jgi:hypothetical protein
MRAPISVILPCVHNAPDLSGVLRALTEGLNAGLIRELILVDATGSEDLARLADAAGADLIAGQGAVLDCAEQGITQAQGAWMLVLTPQTQLPMGWSERVIAVLNRPGRYCFPAQGWRAVAQRLGLRPDLSQGILVARAQALCGPARRI